MRTRVFAIVALFLALFVYPSVGQVPRTLSYQGVLTDSLGHPKADGTYSFSFRLYSTSSGGSALWTETKTLSVAQGLFTTVLGDQVPLALPFDAPYWLSIQVASDPELAPRLPLTSAAYSMHSVKSDTALYAQNASVQASTDSARIAGTVPNNSLTAVKIQTGQVVKSLNGLKDSVTLAAGNNVTLTPSGNTLTIAASPGGITLPFSSTVNSGSTLFSLTNSGNGGTARFAVSNGSDTNAALRSHTTGMGRAGYFTIDNSGSSAQALEARVLNGGGTGVFGSSLQAFGVYGESKTATGVYGSCDANIGVGGQGGHGGVYGLTNSTSFPDAAIKGNVTASTGGAAGVYGDASTSPSGMGVYGTGGSIGGYFTGGQFGVYSTSSDGVGIEGSTNASSNNNSGVLGVAVQNSGAIIGVRGVSTNSPQGIGMQGEGQARGVYGLGSGSGSNGVFGESVGMDGTGVTGRANNGATAYGLWGISNGGYAVVCNGTFYQSGGTFEAHPTSTTWSTNKPATVKLNDGAKVKLFSEEAAEVYFNDYGEATLTGGRVHVDLDPKFVQTVTIDRSHPMKVFVQLEGDCKGVYVTNKTATGFDVVELQGGTSNAQLTYRVVCKRKYYEDERLATDEQDVQYNSRVLQTAWPEVVARQQADMARAEQLKPAPPKPTPKPPLPDAVR